VPDIAGALAKKIGPLPGYAWGALAAVGVWWFFIRGKSAASGATTNAAAAGSQLSSGYGLGYAQGIQAAGPPAPAGSTPQQSRVVLIAPAGEPGSAHKVAVWAAPSTSSGQLAVYPAGTTLPTNGPPVQGTTFGPYYDLPQSDQWVPVTTEDGHSGYVWAPATALAAAAAAIGGAIGGGRPAGSRSANLMHHAHPLVGARVPYQYHVRAVGGPGNHAREVHRVATQAGVHPARLMMLNPTPTGFIRVA
jgi:hypothetical protein